jgi:hypothetical protein
MARGEKWARRCDTGCETFPDDMEFKRCPICGEVTERFSNGRPIDMEEAMSIKNHATFEKIYEKHCKMLGQPYEGDELPAGPDEAYYDDAWPDNKPRTAQ